MTSGAPTATFFGGANELGGTQILLQVDGQRIWLDFGLNFDRYGKYFTFPQGVKKFNALEVLWKLGVYPGIPSLYRPDYLTRIGMDHPGLEGDELLMSHAHIDHLGGVHYLHWDMPIHMDRFTKRIAHSMQVIGNAPNSEFLDAKITGCKIPKLRDHGSRKIFGETGRMSRDIRTFEPGVPWNIGPVKVHAEYVDHSLAGACAFLLETSIGNIAYTGDLRLRGRHSDYTRGFIRLCQKKGVRYLLTEASLIFKKHVGDEYMLEHVLLDHFKQYSGWKIFACPPRDMERIETFYNVARQLCNWEGREVPLVVDTRIAYLMDSFAGTGLGYPKMEDPGISLFMPRKVGANLDTGNPDLELADYSGFERRYLDHPRRISLDELKALPSCVFFLPSANLDDLVELKPPKDSVYLRSHPEPYTEEMELGEKVVINWLRLFNINYRTGQVPMFFDETYNIDTAHVTGHMSFDEKVWFLSQIPFDYVIPIHTFNARWFSEREMCDPDKIIYVNRREKLELR